MSRADSASWAPGTTRKRFSATALLMIWRKLDGIEFPVTRMSEAASGILIEATLPHVASLMRAKYLGLGDQAFFRTHTLLSWNAAPPNGATASEPVSVLMPRPSA